MTMEALQQGSRTLAVIDGSQQVITDVQSALDLMMMVRYDLGTKDLVVDKRLITEKFFVLSTGLAGEILQRYVNYGVRIAIYGDFSHYTSKPLKDFIYESNQGKHAFFGETKEEAIHWMTSR